MTEKRPELLELGRSELRALRFRPSDSSVTVEVAIGSEERLMDVIDAGEVPVPFGCRAGTCGTCRVEIEGGGEVLEPPDAHECWQLDRLVGASLRLACQARAKRW